VALLAVGLACRESEAKACLRKNEHVKIDSFCAKLNAHRPRYSNRVARAEPIPSQAAAIADI